MALDCHHGRALVDDFSSKIDLVGWHPMTGELRRLPRPDLTCLAHYTAVVLSSAAGCIHLDCLGGALPRRGGHRLVPRDVSAAVYSSNSDEWSTLTSAHLAQDSDLLLNDGKPAALIGDALYFVLVESTRIVFDMGKHCLSLIDPPSVFEGGRGIVLMPLDGDVLGLAAVEDYNLSLWSRNVSLDGVASWKKLSVIDLIGLPPTPDRFGRVVPIAFVEGSDMVFVRTNAGVFTIELRSLSVKKVCQEGFFKAIVPYTSFYTPGVHLQQHNRTQFRLDWHGIRRLQRWDRGAASN